MNNKLDKKKLLNEMERVAKVMKKDMNQNFTQTQMLELKYWIHRISTGEFDT